MFVNKTSGVIRALIGAAIFGTSTALTGAAVMAQQVEVVYGTFLDPNNSTDPRSAAQTKMISAFEEQNPNVKIKLFVNGSGADSARNIKSGLQAPDVWRAATYQLPEYVATGNAEPLDTYIARDGVDKNDWLLPLDSGKVDGHIYGLFQDFRIPLLMYRKKAVADAKVTIPVTWDDVCEMGAKLTKGPVIGFAVPLGANGGAGGAQAFGEFFAASMLSALSGGKYFDNDFLTPAFDKSRLVTMLTTINNLYTKCKSTPKASLSFGVTELHDGLRSGTIAMTIFGLYRYRAVVAGGAGDDLQWAPAPVYNKGDKQAIYGFELMLNKKSAHKEEAWKFLNFMTSTKAEEIAAEGGEVVARKSAYSSPYFKTQDGNDQLEWSKLILKDGFLPNYSRLSSNFAVILGDAIQKMVLLGGTPEQAANEIMEKYSAAVDQAK